MRDHRIKLKTPVAPDKTRKNPHIRQIRGFVQLVDLSETYSNNYSIIREYIKGYKPTSVKPTIDPSITDLSYDPNSTVKTITQQQKNLSELEIQTICERYKNGASSYELAKEFGCHRRTISDTLKRNGVEVSHQATTKPELVKKIIEILEKFTECTNEMYGISEREAFVRGFTLGARIIIEVMNSEIE